MIPVSIPYVSKNQKKYVNDCLDRNWISAFGKYDKALCKSFPILQIQNMLQHAQTVLLPFISTIGCWS